MRANQQQARALIEKEVEFVAGNLRGERNGGGASSAPHCSRLFMPWIDQFHRDVSGTRNYVVWSYDTPIAWKRSDGRWVRPDVKYSVTTSKHQGKCPLSDLP